MHLNPVNRSEYLAHLVGASRAQTGRWREELETWKAGDKTYRLWGYNPPMEPLRQAALLAYLRARGELDAEASRECLRIVRAYSDLRAQVDPGLVASRAETRDKGLPLFINFFLAPVYAEMVMDLRAAGDLAPGDLSWLESLLPPAVELLFSHAEWGAHNRAILRADGLDLAVRALPGHPDAARWAAMADVLAGDSLDRWEIEDASTYHPVWVLFLLRWLERRDRVTVFRSPVLRWYLEYFLCLLAPHGTIPDFGDGEWRSTWFHLVPCFELAAALTRDGRYRWAAARIWRACTPADAALAGKTPRQPWEIMAAHRWVDDSVAPVEPTELSREALEDSIGKKVVLRDGWEAESTYALYTYMDEGSWGWLDRQYLRDTISVEEEKMHHGHSDEGSLAFLMSGGSLLLHDGGYRDGLPSGRWGAYRADYFHNRLVSRPGRMDRGQDLFEYLRNSGAYRPVRTHKIDFQVFRHADYLRTRLVHEAEGWCWDRVVVWLRELGQFLVVDGWLPHRSDYATVACLWHTQTVVARGDGWVVGGYDTMGPERLSPARRLRVEQVGALEGDLQGRTRGHFDLDRHYGPEHTLYESESTSFIAGRWRVFVSRLAVVDGAGARTGSVERLPTDWGDGAVCLALAAPDGARHTVLIKLDLERERASRDIRPRTPWETASMRGGGFTTDAHFTHVVQTRGGLHWSATLLTRLEQEGRVLLDVPRNTFGLQLDGAPDREGQARWRRWEGEG